MKKTYSFLLAFTLMAGLLCSCHLNRISGNGNVISKEIQIEDYDEIEIRGENIDLQYTQSDSTPYLKIETDQNIMELLEIKSDNKELQIQKLLCKIKELEEKYRCTEEEYCSQKTTVKEIIKCLGLEQLTQQAADILIEKVTLYQGKKVEIQWKFGEADKKIT